MKYYLSFALRNELPALDKTQFEEQFINIYRIFIHDFFVGKIKTRSPNGECDLDCNDCIGDTACKYYILPGGGSSCVGFSTQISGNPIHDSAFCEFAGITRQKHNQLMSIKPNVKDSLIVTFSDLTGQPCLQYQKRNIRKPYQSNRKFELG